MMISAAKWLGTLATIVGVVFVAFQYFDGKWKSRIERSLQYVLLYQNPEKIVARNNIDLEPIGEQEDDSTPQDKTNRPASPETVSAESDIDAAKFFPQSTFEMNKIAVKDKLTRCKIYIEQFANERLDINNAVKKPDHVSRISDLLADESIEFENGETVTKYGDDTLWWSEKGTSYHYSWPDITWRFLNQDRSEKGNLSDLEIYKIEECSRLLNEYEFVLNDKSPKILTSLHELKHFYAALSICTTSGLCDAFVACEAFDSEVGAFLAEWQDYFELWGARERKMEYERMHKFVVHCRSNPEFLERLERGISGMLYIQQFTNYCWRLDEQGDGVCGMLKWMADIGTEPD
jgi:hypothetical protein